MSYSSFSEDEEIAPIVLDNGSYLIKAGIAGDDAPRAAAFSMIAYPVSNKNNDDKQSKPLLSVKYAVEHGIITSINDMEAIWYHLFYNELKIDPSERQILLTEPPLNPKSNRELMVKIMFETFDCISTYIKNQGILSLYAYGRTTGCSLDIGDGVTACVPIWEGYAISPAIRRRNFAGKEITNYLIDLLKIKGHSFSTSMEREIIRDLKEKECFVAMNYEEEIDEWESSVGTKGIDKKYQLPDGQVINVNMERFKSSELLFKPELINVDSVGIHELLHESIMASDIDTRRDLYGNIVVSGGTTCLSGFTARMEKEMQDLTDNCCKIRVVVPAESERKTSVWVGGSILASLSTFRCHWITKEEYDEEGVNIVHRKCDI